MRPFTLLAFLVLMVGPSWASAASSITVSNPWFRYLLPQVPAGGFMTLHNASAKPAVLTGVRSPACGMAMLHESITKSGMDAMIGVKTITVPAHSDFSFSPGRYHVMCMEPKMKLGETVPVTLLFQDAPAITISFAVYGADGPKATR